MQHYLLIVHLGGIHGESVLIELLLYRIIVQIEVSSIIAHGQGLRLAIVHRHHGLQQGVASQQQLFGNDAQLVLLLEYQLLQFVMFALQLLLQLGLSGGHHYGTGQHLMLMML